MVVGPRDGLLEDLTSGAACRRRWSPLMWCTGIVMSYLQSDTTISATSHGRTVAGALVLGELKALNGVWVGRIRAPGQRRRRDDGFTIRQAMFIRTLRPLLDIPLVAHATPAQIAVLVNAYWDGIATVMPDPFAPATNPQSYLIQQDHGASVLHSVLPQVIEVLPSWGRSLADPRAYADVLHELPTLSGEIVTDNGVERVSDAAFWRSGPAGAASQFSGEVGRARLSAEVRALIPRVAEGLEI